MKEIILCILISLLILMGCALTQKTIDKEKAERPIQSVHTDQETQSSEVFNQILDLIQSSEDRQAVLPQIEELYAKIIKEYPEAPLAQESYWKLITIYVEDYSPPAYEKADNLYHEFMEKYPHSILRSFVDDTIGKSYYKHAQWDRLLKLCTPAYQEYTEKGKIPRASLIFMFSEANYNLGNLDEAVKGYKITADLFPKLTEGSRAKIMLEKISK